MADKFNYNTTLTVYRYGGKVRSYALEGSHDLIEEGTVLAVIIDGRYETVTVKSHVLTPIPTKKITILS